MKGLLQPDKNLDDMTCKELADDLRAALELYNPENEDASEEHNLKNEDSFKKHNSEENDTLFSILFKTRHPNHEAYEENWGDYYFVEKVLALVLVFPAIITVIIVLIHGVTS